MSKLHPQRKRLFVYICIIGKTVTKTSLTMPGDIFIINDKRVLCYRSPCLYSDELMIEEALMDEQNLKAIIDINVNHR